MISCLKLQIPCGFHVLNKKKSFTELWNNAISTPSSHFVEKEAFNLYYLSLIKCRQTTVIKVNPDLLFNHITETQGINSNVLMITNANLRLCWFACSRFVSHSMLIPFVLFYLGIFFFWCSCVFICIIIFLSVNSWIFWFQWNHGYWCYFIESGFRFLTYFASGSGEKMCLKEG